MEGGERRGAGAEELDAARERARREVARLPEPILALEPADPPYPVEVSRGLESYQDQVVRAVEERTAARGTGGGRSGTRA